MSCVRLWLRLALCGVILLGSGWVQFAAAASEAPEVGGRGEGFQPEGKEEAREAGKKEEAKEDECPSTFGPIITDTAIPIEKGKFAIQPTFGLSFVTNSLTQSWRRVPAGGDFKSFGMSAKFTYGLLNNLEVYMVIPYIHNWASNVTEPGPNGERAANFGGLGDINLTFKYRLVEEGPVAPTVSAIFAPTFPSGHFQHLNPGRLGMDQLGGGSYKFTTGFNLSKYLKPFIFYANFYYTMGSAYSTKEDRGPLIRDENDELVEGDPVSTRLRIYPRDYVTVNLAAEYPITKKWIALVELTSTWDGGRLFGHKANIPPGALLSLLPGIEYMATDKFSLALGVNIDLVGKNTDANITPILSMVYAF